MLKRLLDLAVAIPASIVSAPVIVVLMLAIWFYDRSNPLYIPRRIGKNGKPFPFFKLRTMIVNADRTGVDTTVKGDSRLLPFAETMRRYKLDELPQFWNVILGDMSLVGPRPNVSREVEKYTEEERRLLSVRPGLTDFASIVFSDLADRLAGVEDANRAYERDIRPWKSRLALFYVDRHTIPMDVVLIAATAVSVVNRPLAIRIVCQQLKKYSAPHDLSRLICDGQPSAMATPSREL